MQYHFLDECGDLGLSYIRGTSSYFVVSMIELETRVPIPMLQEVRTVLNVSPNFEFKFHRGKHRQKQIFFESVQDLPFRIRSAVVNKSLLTHNYQSLSSTEILVDIIVSLTLRASEKDIANDILIIDGAVPSLIRNVRVNLTAKCRSQERLRPFKKILGAESHREDGLQIADMVAGATMRFARDRDGSYYRFFADKVVDLWEVHLSGE